MMGQTPDQAESLIPRPELTLPALRAAVARVAPGRLPEMFGQGRDWFQPPGRSGNCLRQPHLPPS